MTWPARARTAIYTAGALITLVWLAAAPVGAMPAKGKDPRPPEPAAPAPAAPPPNAANPAAPAPAAPAVETPAPLPPPAAKENAGDQTQMVRTALPPACREAQAFDNDNVFRAVTKCARGPQDLWIQARMRASLLVAACERNPRGVDAAVGPFIAARQRALDASVKTGPVLLFDPSTRDACLLAKKAGFALPMPGTYDQATPIWTSPAAKPKAPISKVVKPFAKLWEKKFKVPRDDGQIVVHGRLIAVPVAPGGLAKEDGIAILDAAGSLIRVIASVGAPAEREVRGVALADDHVYFGTKGGVLVKARLDGRYAWTTRLAGEIVGVPAFVASGAQGPRVVARVRDAKGDALAIVDDRTGYPVPNAAPRCPLAIRGFATPRNLVGTDIEILCDKTGRRLPDGTEPKSQPYPQVMPAPFDVVTDRGLGVASIVDGKKGVVRCFLDGSPAGKVRCAKAKPKPSSQRGRIAAAFGLADRNVALAYTPGKTGVTAHDAQGASIDVVADAPPAVMASVGAFHDKGDSWNLLLATADGSLIAYDTGLHAPAYLTFPYGDSAATGNLPEIASSPREARETAFSDDNRWLTAGPEPGPAFVSVSDSVASRWKAGDRQAFGVKAPDGTFVPLYVALGDAPADRPSRQGRLASRLFVSGDQIVFLDGTEAIFVNVEPGGRAHEVAGVNDLTAAVHGTTVLATPDRLIELSGPALAEERVEATQARPVARVAIEPGGKRVWLGFNDGGIGYRITGQPGIADAKIVDAERTLAPTDAGAGAGLQPVASVDDPIVALAATDDELAVGRRAGTRLYGIDADGRLIARSALAVAPGAPDALLRCGEGGSGRWFAIARGRLIEASQGATSWISVDGAPASPRSLVCGPGDAGDLYVVAADGVFRLPGMPRLPWLWWVGLVLAVLVASGAALAWIGKRKEEPEAPAEGERGVLLQITPDVPLRHLEDTQGSQRDLIEALIKFLDNKDTVPPLTLAVCGAWGSGKTSVMEILRGELRDRHRYVDVWFNAWRYQREDQMAAALLQTVVDEFRRQAPWRTRVRLAYLRMWNAGLRDRIVLGLSAFVGLAAVALVGHVASDLLRTGTRSGVGELTLGGMSAMAMLAGARELWKTVVAPFASIFKLTPATMFRQKNYEKRIGFIREFSREFELALAALPASYRLVVFIDDLDRCPPEKVMDVLEALNMLTEARKCFFVMGMDPEAVRRAIALKHGELLELLDRGERERYASRYLEKLITASVDLPPVAPVQTDAAALKARQDAQEEAKKNRARQEQRRVRFAWARNLITLGVVVPAAIALSTPLREKDGLKGFFTNVHAELSPPETVKANVPLPAPVAAPLPLPHEKDQLKDDGGKKRKVPQEKEDTPRPAAVYTYSVSAPMSSWAVATAPAALASAPDVVLLKSAGIAQLQLAGWILAGLLCLGVALALWQAYQRFRDDLALGPRAKDDPTFSALLDRASALILNPRQRIRFANNARLLYTVISKTLTPSAAGWEQALFLLLLVRQLDPAAGIPRGEATTLQWCRDNIERAGFEAGVEHPAKEFTAAVNPSTVDTALLETLSSLAGIPRRGATAGSPKGSSAA